MSRKVIYMSILLGGLLACNPSTEGTNKSRGNEASEIIGKVEATIAKDIMTPEVLYSFGRVGGPILPRWESARLSGHLCEYRSE